MSKKKDKSQISPRTKDSQMKTQRRAVVYMKGDPGKVAEKVMPALYGSVYKLKFKLKRKV